MSSKDPRPGESAACECGARLEEGRDRCRKCLAWDRWRRRQAARQRNLSRSRDDRRPPRGPRRTGRPEVTR
ncbi:hypothetical protein [Spongiactinospora sp. 9N601]|uniref:hypothetical protein n=1 Tax=Spongiactinospora sp. 9N601 TaxID=3375149 RepID=UPI0037B9373D